MTRSQNQSLLKNSLLNGWSLFWLITTIISIFVIIPFAQIDAGNPAHLSSMIQQSVRLAVPWLFIAFAASSLVKILPNQTTKWIMKNRRIFGLIFAAGMAWQLFFILWMVLGFTDYYMAEAYSYYDLSEQIPGYLILFAMTFTSFKFGRQKLSNKQWHRLHKWGIYFLWYVVWSTYWFELYYYEGTQVLDHIYYWMGIVAWSVRISAWAMERSTKITKKTSAFTPIIVIASLMGGLFLIAFGNIWSPSALKFLSNYTLGGWIELFVPLLLIIPIYMAALVTRTNIPKSM